MYKIASCIASFGYIGYLPKAPGTFGSLAALPFAWFLWQLPFVYAAILCALCFALGIWAAQIVIAQCGVEDHQSIVLDEVVGIFITCAFNPPSLWAFASAFFLFRLFDILKPWPVSWFDKNVKGGLGAMLDDTIAAFLALAVQSTLLYFGPKFGLSF